MNKKGYLTNTQNLDLESSKLLNEIDWFEIKQDNDEQDPVKKFKTKTDKLIHSDFVVADLNNLTTETAMELGIIYGIAYSKAVMDEMFSNTDYELQAASLKQKSDTAKAVADAAAAQAKADQNEADIAALAAATTVWGTF